MPIFNRGPRVIDNSTGRDVTPGKGGRHRRDEKGCTVTWGTCDVRSDDPYLPVGQKRQPHVCSEPGEHTRHICMACNTPQA